LEGVEGVIAASSASVGPPSHDFAPSSIEPASAPIPTQSSTPFDLTTNLEDIADDYLSSFKQKVLNKLQDLSPEQFEEFAGSLLKGYGFQKVAVTGKSGDGGIDGHGQLRVGLATIKAAFQCKRWQQAVGPKEVQAFRGAIQGQFEQGYFFTTSTFTKAAQEKSIKMGAARVVLFGGDQGAGIMIEKGVGIRRRPVEVYEDQIDQLFEK
jgi:restriction system protein